MLIKKETSTIVQFELNEVEKLKFKNYSRGEIDHCTLELVKGVYFVFCKSTSDNLILFNGHRLFVGELEFAVKQEVNCHEDIVIKYCSDNSCNIGNVLGYHSLIQPIFNNNKISYDYVNDNLYCYNPLDTIIITYNLTIVKRII